VKLEWFMAAALPDWMIMAEVHDSLSFEGEEIDVVSAEKAP
jgi:hypothetical protein